MPLHPSALTSGTAFYILFNLFTQSLPISLISKQRAVLQERLFPQNSAQRKVASKQKSVNWTKEEPKVLLQSWGPNYDQRGHLEKEEGEFGVTFMRITSALF